MRASLRPLSDRAPLADIAAGVGPVCVGVVGSPGVVRAAFDAGINLFAVAVDMHWPAYEATRRGLVELLRDRPGARDELVVMGLAYGTNPRFCHAPFAELLEAEPSLRRIDVTAMGAAGDQDFLVRWNEHAKHRAGSVPGVRAVAGLLEGLVCARVAINHRLVDLAFLANRPSLHHAMPELLGGLASPPSVPVFAMGMMVDAPSDARLGELGIGADKWRPTPWDYVRYALSFEPFTGVFCDLASERSVVELDAAFRKGPLTDEEIQYLEDLADLHLGLAELGPG